MALAHVRAIIDFILKENFFLIQKSITHDICIYIQFSDDAFHFF